MSSARPANHRSSPDLPTRDEWAVAIGRFILEFCECEWWTHHLIRMAGSDADVETARTMLLGGRKGLLTKLLSAPPFTDGDREAWSALLVTMNRLEQKRDIVAHNPPLHGFLIDKRGRQPFGLRFDLRSIRRSDIEVTISELARLREQAVELQHSLGALSVQFEDRRTISDDQTSA